MSRIIIIVNGLCGGFVGFGVYVFIMALCITYDVFPHTLFGDYCLLFGLPILAVIIGFWLAVREDWWRMKREW